jgi:hypothetical protein
MDQPEGKTHQMIILIIHKTHIMKPYIREIKFLTLTNKQCFELYKVQNFFAGLCFELYVLPI